MSQEFIENHPSQAWRAPTRESVSFDLKWPEAPISVLVCGHCQVGKRRHFVLVLFLLCFGQKSEKSLFFPSKNRPIAEKNEDQSQCPKFLWLLEEKEWKLNSCWAGKGLLFATKPSWLAAIIPALICVLCCHWPLVTFSTALKIPMCQVLRSRQAGMDSLNRHLLRNPLWVKNTF